MAAEMRPAWSDFAGLREALHREPELAWQERGTAEKVIACVRAFQPDQILTGIAGYGLACVFEMAEPGDTVLFRCELDALPIQETNRFAHRSIVPNVSHKCGHDGHMTILLALAAMLKQRPFARGRVVLLFQPAEETGEGGPRVVADERFRALKPDYVFALHNVPGSPMGRVLLRPGGFTCASVGLQAHLTGKTSHAAYPEHGLSPLFAVAEITRDLLELPKRPEPAQGFSLVTVTHTRVGVPSFGVAPGEAEILATMRAERDVDLDRLCRLAEKVVADRVASAGLTHTLQWRERFQATKNDPRAWEWVRRACEDCGVGVIEPAEPIRWSEDFAHFTAAWPGAMFGLGAGEATPQLHNPDYDFPNELIEIGARLFYAIAARVLGGSI